MEAVRRSKDVSGGRAKAQASVAAIIEFNVAAAGVGRGPFHSELTCSRLVSWTLPAASWGCKTLDPSFTSP